MIRGQVVTPATIEKILDPPDWLLDCRLMLLLNKTEKEIDEGMSPAMIRRLLWVVNEDTEHDRREQAEREANDRLKQKMSGSSIPTTGGMGRGMPSGYNR